MSNPKIVKVAKIGSPVIEVAVNDTMTVGQTISAAGYSPKDGTLYGKNGDGAKVIVEADEAVNGYVQIFITKNVKGGSQ